MLIMLLPGAHEGLGLLSALVWGCSPPDLSAVQGECRPCPKPACRSSWAGAAPELFSRGGRRVLQALHTLQHLWVTECSLDLDNFKSSFSVTSSRYCNKTSLWTQGQANNPVPVLVSFLAQQKGKEKKRKKCFHAVNLLKSHSKVCFDSVSFLPPAWPYSFVFLSLGLDFIPLKALQSFQVNLTWNSVKPWATFEVKVMVE